MTLSDMVPAYKTASCFTSDGLLWAIDSQSYRTGRECWRKFYYQVMLGLRSTSDAAPLTFGILTHLGRETYFRSRYGGKDHRQALHEMLRAVIVASSSYDEAKGCWKPWWSLDKKRNTITLLRTLVLRMDDLQNDAATTMTIAGKPAVELPFRFELGRKASSTHQYTLCGILDRLLDHGRIFSEDAKTTTSGFISQESIQERFWMDPQMTIYTIASQVIYHQPVGGVLIDMHSIQIGDSTFLRAVVDRPEEYVEEWLEQLGSWIDELEINLATNRWEMRDTSCFLCSFKKVCSKGASLRPNYLESGYYQHIWNPLTARDPQ